MAKKKVLKKATMADYVADRLRSVASNIKKKYYGDNPRYILLILDERGEAYKFENFTSDTTTIGFLEQVKTSIITGEYLFKGKDLK